MKEKIKIYIDYLKYERKKNYFCTQIAFCGSRKKCASSACRADIKRMAIFYLFFTQKFIHLVVLFYLQISCDSVLP